MAACLDQNDLYPARGDLPFRRCETIEERSGAEVHMIYRSAGCMHCGDAPCISACPSGCLYKDEETGFTLYDNEACTGCQLCLEACPYDAPVFPKRGDFAAGCKASEGPETCGSVSSGKMEKCDGCAERVKRGMEPACVKVCPFGALKIEEVTI